MKRILFLIFSITLINAFPLLAKGNKAEQQTFHPFTGKIIGNKVRLRLSPNLEGHIIKELAKGEIYAIVAENNDYYAVTPKEDLKAYVFRTHILDNKVEGNHVNIRLAPDLEAPIIGQLNSGDEVQIDAKNSKGKWYQITPPKNVHLWVAKDYVQKVGPVGYAEKYSERIAQANQLLATANLISQAEFRKPFQELDLERVIKNYERVLKDYNDLEVVQHHAKSAIQTLQKEYCDRKIEFLENKAGKAALEVKSLNAKLSTINTPAMDEQLTENSFTNLLNNSQATDKMKIWQPVEYAKFQSWAFNNEKKDASLQDFYQEELISCKSVNGIIESFSKTVKSSPGDYVLTRDGQTVAYLYSTHVNLNNYLGKQVNVKVSKRDNHNFAFPAYYVLDVQND